MIGHIIRWSLAHRALVLLAALAMALWGVWSVSHTPLGALPDLAGTEVIIRTPWAGQPPRVIDDQVTYPLSTAMLTVPHARAVRGFSMFGTSFVYVLFDEGTDLYWARDRVLANLSRIQGQLPDGVHPTLGPVATGVDWIYEYALVDTSGQHSLGQLTSLQNWFLRYQLESVPGIQQVATLGGAQRAWQVVPDPEAMAARGITMQQLVSAIRSANAASGGSVIEQGEAEFMVRSVGYLTNAADFRKIPVKTGPDGTPVLLGQVATVRRGPLSGRGLAELDGQGAVVGGIVIMRSGENALTEIQRVKARIQSLQKSLPQGVKIVSTYDPSLLIHGSVNNLGGKLLEEFIVVALVCLLFLWHFRSALVAVVALPLGVLIAFILLDLQGVQANIMSLSGIAIAIGEMVDAAIVMIENMHRHVEAWADEHDGAMPTGAERWRLVGDAAVEVGPALFVSLLVITLSFVPVFALEAQTGRLFKPLAFTKSYAVAAGAGLSVTLIPVLMGYFIRGRIRPEYRNPINRGLAAAFRPALNAVLRFPAVTLVVTVLVMLSMLIPLSRLGTTFLPQMNEGNLLYMPTALPGISAGKTRQLLQQTDRMLKSVPEVEHVFGKAGRADTATDPAPLSMFETTITFKPKDEWRPGMTMDKLRKELDQAVNVPGLTNLFVYPIHNRVEMQTTGIKSPIGLKILGPDVTTLQHLARTIVATADSVSGVASASSDQANGGRYVNVHIRPEAAARYGLTQAQIQSIVATAVGGAPIGHTVEGRARHPIVVRYPRESRDSVAALRRLPIVAENGAQVTLGQVADIRIEAGPPMLKSEDGQLATYVYIDTNRDASLGTVVANLKQTIADQVTLPAGYTLQWSGNFVFLQQAQRQMRLIIPLVLVIIFGLIFSVFRRVGDALLIMVSLPAALAGGLWLVWLMGESVSVATIIGFIGLGGVAAEFGVVMMLYLHQAWNRKLAVNPAAGERELDAAIREGAGDRVRPLAMTAAVITAGLLPILDSGGFGHELMQPIAAPMVGGMITAPILSMLFIPAGFRFLERWRLRKRRMRAS